MSETAEPSAAAPSAFTPGRVIGQRFAVEQVAWTDALGTMIAARDQKTKKAVALRILGAQLFASAPAGEVLKTEIRVATTSVHKNLASVYGSGAEGGLRFVASEWLTGRKLSEIVAERRASGDPFPIAAAIGIVTQVCDALTPLHAKNAAHAALRPSAVFVADTVARLSEAGLARAVIRTAGAAGFGEDELPFTAPELRQGASEPTLAADVFGLGGLLYAVLCLRSPAEAFVPPSQAHPEGTPAMDQTLMRCLASNPAQRFASVTELRAALMSLVPGATASAGLESADIELDIPMSVAPAALSMAPAPSIPKAAPTPRIAGPGGAPAVGQRVSIHEDFRASAPSIDFMDAPKAVPAQQSAQVDIGALLKKITENDAPRWMAQKDGLDHGPFSGRELVDLIVKGEVLGEHGLLNMDTGERKKVGEWSEYTEFVDQYRLKSAAAAEKHALTHSAKQEKAGNVAKFLVAGAVILGVLGIGGAFLYTRQAEQAEQVANSQLADLFERGDLEIEGAAGILPDPPPTRRRTGGGGGGGGGGHLRAGGSYEEAMAQAVDMGDVTGSGSQSRLNPAQVAGIMNGRINSMFGCVSEELRRGHSPGRVRIDIAIAGSGQVLGSSVRAGSPAFQSCIQARVAAIHFPSFGAPRMGASYAFNADQ